MGYRRGLAELIGNTPLVRLRRASELTGCEIIGKAEFMNPGGSVKDRTALGIVRDAERRGLLRPGGRIVEGTAGNTGIGLSLLANALGYRTTIVIPETQSPEKIDMLMLCGAELKLVPAVPASDPNHYVKVSGRLAEELAAREANGVLWANQFDNTANRDAQNSAEVVRKAVEAMDGISNSSTQIGRIIGVIDEIAFQTSLLALNAGVEAARAGEAGRGFAVVASEVRALAQRSAEAAKEIKILVSTSSDLVDNGVRLVDDAGASLARIMSQVAEINELIGDIASGAVEQSTAIAQVNVAVNQMDQMTQQNAAMVEESAAAGDALSQEATSLADLVGQFRIGASTAALRSELRRTVPHAFAQPSPTTRSPSSNPRGRSVEPVRQARAAGSRGSSADWEEF